MDELLKQSDVVSLNLPLNDKTKGSFGKKQFDMMKEGAALVNTARGAIVDEEALIEALESGKVSLSLTMIDVAQVLILLVGHCWSRRFPK